MLGPAGYEHRNRTSFDRRGDSRAGLTPEAVVAALNEKGGSP